MALPKQELVSLVTSKRIMFPVTPESGLVREGNTMTLTRVETCLAVMEIMETIISKQRDISLCNEKEVTFTLC